MQTGMLTGGHDEANSHFSQFCERAKKRIIWTEKDEVMKYTDYAACLTML